MQKTLSILLLFLLLSCSKGETDTFEYAYFSGTEKDGTKRIGIHFYSDKTCAISTMFPGSSTITSKDFTYHKNKNKIWIYSGTGYYQSLEGTATLEGETLTYVTGSFVYVLTGTYH